MPTFRLTTNVPKDAIPDELLGRLTEQLAKATGKPAEVTIMEEGGGYC